MYALSSATVRRLVVLARQDGVGEIPAFALGELDDRAIHYGRQVEDPANVGAVVLELAVRLRSRRGLVSQRATVYLDDTASTDVLVPVPVLLEALAILELRAWPAPQDVVPA